jgi:hypothetical protein
MKVDVLAQGLSILAVHHKYQKLPFFNLSIGKTRFLYEVFYDHALIRSEYGNV